MSKKQNNLFFLIWGAFALLFLLTFNIQSYDGKKYAVPSPGDEFYNEIPANVRANLKNKTDALILTMNANDEADGYFLVYSKNTALYFYYWKWLPASTESERYFTYATNSSLYSPALTQIKVRTISISATSNYGSVSTNNINFNAGAFPAYYNDNYSVNYRPIASSNFTVKNSSGQIVYPISSDPDIPPTPGGDGESTDYTGILGIIQNLIRSIIDKLTEMIGLLLEPLTFITDYITEKVEELTSITDKLMLVMNNLLTRFESYTLEPIITFFSGLSAGAIAFYMAFYNLPILNDLFLAVLTLAVVGLILKLLEV